MLIYVLITCSVNIEKSNGRVLANNGNLFYSPNCSRVVPIPILIPHDIGHNPFYPSKRPMGRINWWDLDPSTYCNPQWWSRAFGWISFFQTSESQFANALFSRLKFSKTQLVVTDIGYVMSPWEREEWLRLDNQLCKACEILQLHYGLAAVTPVHPWSMGYLRPHDRYGTLMVSLRKSREWFPVWMAVLSFLIAGSQTVERQLSEFSSRSRLHWKELLVAEGVIYGIDQRWIDLLSQSTVASFSDSIARAGVFFQLPPAEDYQPDPFWYCEFGIPVWYPWGHQQINDPKYKHLAPLPHQLQEVATFITKSPSKSAPHKGNGPGECSGAEDQCAVPLSVSSSSNIKSHPIPSTEQMDEFFKIRDERNTRKRATETEQMRQVRLSRERQPPINSAPMYLWMENSRGEYEREAVPRKRREDMFDLYGENQIRYDSVQNEYNICDLWGDYPDDHDDDDGLYPSYEGDMRDRGDLPLVGKDSGVEDLLEHDGWVGDGDGPHGDRSSLPERLEGEILDVASLFFGYTPLLPLPTVAPLQGEVAQKSFCRSFGICWENVKTVLSTFERPSVAAAADFFNRLAQRNQVILDDEWDLMPRNHQAIMLKQRFMDFRRVQSKGGKQLYMLDLKERRSAKWILALKCASDAAVVCRLDINFNEFDIVEFLLTHGIPFHTLCPSNTIIRTPSVVRPSLDLPTRPAEFVFDGLDYLAYRERCNAILKHPRGRAALMRGHYMWRLAINTVPWEAVLDGPSGWSPVAGEMVVVDDLLSGMELIDDELSEAEEDALCGTHHCYTGKFSKYASLFAPEAQNFRQW